MAYDVRELLVFFEQHLKVKWRGAQGAARCPFHDDCKASLAVNRTSGLWFCHACNLGGTAREFAERLGIEAPAGNRQSAGNPSTTATRKARCCTKWCVPGKKFRQRRPEEGGWLWKLDGVRRVPYRLPDLPQVTAATSSSWKARRTLKPYARTGSKRHATPAAPASGTEEFGEHLRGRVCILIADNDEPGRKHVEDVARKLTSYAEKIINLGALPESPEHGDASDWLAAGHSIAELLALVTAAEQTHACLAHRAHARSRLAGAAR